MPERTLIPAYDAETRVALRKAIATDIFRVAQRYPMTLTADGGELCTLLAELILRRIESTDTEPVSFAPGAKSRLPDRSRAVLGDAEHEVADR
ncbi:hypothetical protein [Nocardia farcinica]|uniref:hypothetical protein n=1 Tax=Nocardia farcinica TaxID=37329 RepID=UPI00245868E5|nr:hypothetical protein [Nocardia farcinica]